MLEVRTPHGVVAVQVDGPDDGPPVVLLHGFPDAPSTWDQVVDGLPTGTRVIRPTLRGVGGSRTDREARSGQVAALASDVLSVLDALALDDVVLVGHDWGARAAHAVAALEPGRLRALVTIATAYGPRTHLTAAESLDDAAVAWYRWWLCTEAGAASFRRDPGALVTWAWDRWSPPAAVPQADRAALLAAFENDEFVETVVHYYRHGAGEAAGNTVYAGLQARLDTWPPIDVPTTFLIGTSDGCETLPAAHGLGALFPRGIEVVELPGVGHFVQREAPDAVLRAVLPHLSRA